VLKFYFILKYNLLWFLYYWGWVFFKIVKFDIKYDSDRRVVNDFVVGVFEDII
jgi:hypothetical protein